MKFGAGSTRRLDAAFRKAPTIGNALFVQRCQTQNMYSYVYKILMGVISAKTLPMQKRIHVAIPRLSKRHTVPGCVRCCTYVLRSNSVKVDLSSSRCNADVYSTPFIVL